MSVPPEAPPPLRGLVLGGGRSTRMGRDKAALIYRDDLPQLEIAARLLEPYCRDVQLSVRPGQELPPAAAHRPALPDRYENLGPLAGILSAFDLDPAAAWLVVACDLPLLDSATLAHLVAHRDPAAPATAFASAENGLPEPLCAIYEPTFLAPMRAAAAEGRTCPRGLMKRNPVRLLPLPNPAALDNANDPAEAARLAGQLAAQPRVTVHYFGQLRDQAGCDRESIATGAATCAGLFAECAARHRFTLPARACRPAVNHALTGWDTPVRAGDQIAFLPPVAGG